MIGERALRKEDGRLLSGRGRYLADHDVVDLHHVAILRSPVAHAVIRSIDITAARVIPGVVAVVTQDDVAAAGARRMSHRLPLAGIKPLEWGLLAADRVRFVGEPVAAVVARSRAIAEDAIESIVVEYDELSAVVDPVVALEPGAPILYPEWGTNAFFSMATPMEAVDDALERAPFRRTVRIEHHRVHALPLETSGAQAHVDPSSGRLVLISSTQQPHQLRTVVSEVLGLSEAEVRIISPDMGGGFGNKQHFTREECLVGLLARLTGLPVRWAQDRTEGLTSSVHSREQIHDITVGYDGDGRVLAYKVILTNNVGNPVLYFSGIGPSLVTVGSLSGGYDFGVVGFELRCVATTTCPIGAYRGFGQPQAHVSTERILDLVAAELGIDPAEVRRRNLIPDAPRPWIADGGARLDVGPLGPHLDELLEHLDYQGWRARQAEARRNGRLVGIGLSTLVQGTAPTQYGIAGRFGSFETASLSVLPDGKVTVAVGTKSQGQSHETVLAQIAADALGCSLGDVTVREGDTDLVAYGMGTWGSRTAVMGGGAVLTAATRLGEKVAMLAAHMGGQPTLAQVAEEAWWHPHRLPHGVEPGLTVTAVYSPGGTIPVPDEQGHTNFDETFGAHMTAVVAEVDPATGTVTVLDAVLVSDCGRVINPAVVEGQHQGGFAQGIGNVLYEEIRYDGGGQPLTTTLLDYLVPTAVEVPVLRVVHRQTPSTTAGGFRGVGEAAIIATPAALTGAVGDALAPLGITIRSTRLHAHHLRALLRAAGHQPDPVRFAKG